ncbi:IucA/IucC family protein [Cupriavidus metallidurans]|uniref:Siderophore biosynthesis protein n=1 Tax=Cupriavidus metallidurans (strain ATCC 43123 / DSM 2839 / NBRC 102507 / CH34) TaxID=266264 RepID=Q1LPC8_CUPMC|nr:IucA/IucC family protein [Cupriavidus metallidurans]ABF07998.1 putative siderophore biosynthesis protein [Cupriavidus metallidurans CH34]QGS27723.1 IucA/IucC family siderophore biosynthesis protein [Cupriavidus metallidurans]
MQIDDYQALIQSDHYRRATQRVIRQLMEALLFEDVFRDTHWTTGSVTLPAVAADGQPVRYRCAVRRIDAFGRIRLGNVIRAHGGDETAADDVSRLLHELAGQFDADPQRIQQFAMELLSTQLKDAHSHHANGASGQLLRDADYDTVEARLTGAHPYHPSYKSRLGFTMIDNARFAPECASAVHPVLLAARRDRCRTSASATVPGQSAGALLSDAARQHFDAALARYGADPADYLPLPVHPWQWAEVAAPTFHAAFAQGDLIAIGTLPERYLPQQSIRTLASLDHPGAPSLKLAMNMVNTSTSRVLAPHTVCNAAPLSDWLASLVGGTTWTPPIAAPILLREVAGVSYMPAAPAQGQYGALSCIWRESIHGHLAPGERALPMTALAHRDSDGEPLLAPWLDRYGAATWVRRLIERAWLPVLHLLWVHGIALESHAQNMLLIHVDGLPERVALKDFHDGVRFSRQWLSAEPPTLTAPPPEHALVNPNSFIETDDADELRDFTCDALFFVNLAEFGAMLADHGYLEEPEFWRIVAGVIRDYQADHPELAERFARFDCFVPTIAIELLASRRFLPEVRLRTRDAPNPLASAPTSALTGSPTAAPATRLTTAHAPTEASCNR